MMQANTTAPHAIFGGYTGYSVGVAVYLRSAGVHAAREASRLSGSSPPGPGPGNGCWGMNHRPGSEERSGEPHTNIIAYSTANLSLFHEYLFKIFSEMIFATVISDGLDE
jgi:hypothetical protein